MVEAEVRRVLDHYGGYDQTNVTIIKNKIDDALNPRMKEIEEKILDLFKRYSDDKGVQTNIKRKRLDQLSAQIRQHLFNWQEIIQRMLGEFNEKKS